MRDPLDSEKRAYEVLGVGRDATLAEINAAYARRTAKEPRLRQELTLAWQLLRKAATRLKEDFWFYPVGYDEAVQPKEAKKRQALFLDPVLPVPAAGLGREFTDLAEERCRRDFGPIEFRSIKLSSSERYAEEPDLTLPIVFDR